MNKISIENSFKIANILLFISVFMLLSGGVSSLLIGLKEDKQKTLLRMEEVNNVYSDYSDILTSFEEERDIIYNEVFNNITFDNMYSSHKEHVNRLLNYEAMVDQMEKHLNKLDKLCVDIYYPDSKVNSICNNYKSIFEQVNNYYVLDIDTFNKNIDKYNQYMVSVNANLVLKKFETKKELIDFDEDGVIAGKDEGN